MTTARLRHGPEGRWLLDGAVTKDTVLALLVEGEALLGAGGAVALDLGELDQFDSTALALLLEWSRRLRAGGGTLALERVPDQLRQVAEVCGVAQVLAIAPVTPSD